MTVVVTVMGVKNISHYNNATFDTVTDNEAFDTVTDNAVFNTKRAMTLTCGMLTVMLVSLLDGERVTFLDTRTFVSFKRISS